MTACPKLKPIRDRKWLDAHAGMPCMACGTEDGTVVAAHMSWGNNSGMGMKAGDDLVWPLCRRCHADQEANPGPEWWYRNVLCRLARLRYEAWLEQRNGERR